MGIEEEWIKGKREGAGLRSQTNLPERDFLRRRLENEINALYDRLTKTLKEENARLREENEKLRKENEKLRVR